MTIKMMPDKTKGKPIRYFDRYRKKFCLEEVYGDRALRFVYETSTGRLLNWLFFSRPLFSRFYGWQMNRPSSRSKITPFIEKYGLDRSEFKLPVEDFSSFNAFFTRKLKDGERPIDGASDSVVFPADGRHMGWQETGLEQNVFIKGQKWSLKELLGGDGDLMKSFDGGTLVLSRLCPVDYHHYHFPISGTLKGQFWHGTRLNSVSPIALRQKLSYLWSNKRCVNLIETSTAGLCCFIEVGATNVGTIRHHELAGGNQFNKGDPKGWFEFGGSSVITIFQRERVRLSKDLLEFTSQSTELYAKVGDVMGKILHR